MTVAEVRGVGRQGGHTETYGPRSVVIPPTKAARAIGAMIDPEYDSRLNRRSDVRSPARAIAGW
jgi:hypothetical protein